MKTRRTNQLPYIMSFQFFLSKNNFCLVNIDSSSTPRETVFITSLQLNRSAVSLKL
ncbi:hypothetical protein BH20ACI2_BH20ACI2_12000 [soil metagenome]